MVLKEEMDTEIGLWDHQQGGLDSRETEVLGMLGIEIDLLETGVGMSREEGALGIIMFHLVQLIHLVSKQVFSWFVLKSLTPPIK